MSHNSQYIRNLVWGGGIKWQVD